MTKIDTKQPIALIGMMGCGKTATGRSLAEELNFAFSDSDVEIERAEGKSVSQIFADNGESYFRNLEQEAIQRLLNKEKIVLALGGGAILSEVTRTNLQNKAITIWIDTNPKTIVKRLEQDDSRPLLTDGVKEKKVIDLLREREKYYRNADIYICVGASMTVPEVTRECLRKLNCLTEEK